jgi:hypothetical protein
MSHTHPLRRRHHQYLPFQHQRQLNLVVILDHHRHYLQCQQCHHYYRHHHRLRNKQMIL